MAECISIPQHGLGISAGGMSLQWAASAIGNQHLETASPSRLTAWKNIYIDETSLKVMGTKYRP